MRGFLRGLGACGAGGRFAEKNFVSDDHFDRSFAPYRNESQPTKPKKGTTNESINSV
jgi:hypothetical protein